MLEKKSSKKLKKYNIVDVRKDIVLTLEDHGHSSTLYSTWGLFSPCEIDPVTKLLLAVIDVQLNDAILDIGCGYGGIGVPLAFRAKNGSVLMIDKDFVAIEYAQKNIKYNNLHNATAQLSNAFSHIAKEQKFDLIVSNLPAKVGNELLGIIMHDAKKHLNPGGRFCVVTISGLKEYIKRNFKEIFGNYTKIHQSGTFIVSQATVTS